MKSIIITLITFFVINSGNLYAQKDSIKIQSGLNDLIKSAVEGNSRLSPLEYKRRAELTRKNQLSMQPPPGFEFMVEMMPVNFEGRPIYKAMLTQEIILSDRLGESGLLAEAGAKEQEILKDRLRLELIRDIKLNYFSLYLTEKLLDYNKEYEEILLSVIKSQEISYSVGKGVQNHILKSNNELQKLELERLDLESAKDIYINNIGIVSNNKLDTEFRTQNVNLLLIITAPKLDTVKLIKEMLTYNPEFKLIDNKIAQSKIERNIAGYEKTPDIMFKGGYSYNADMYKSFIMVGLGISLPFVPWNVKRIDAKIEETEMLNKMYLEEYNSTAQYLVTDMKNSIRKVNSSLEKIEYLRDVLLPQTYQTFSSSLEAYVTATDDFLNLLDSYRSLREVNLMLLKEQANYLKEISQLEFITGKQIFEIN